jgi:hypothetical protein
VWARAGIAGAVALLASLTLAVPPVGASSVADRWPRGVTVVSDSPLPPRNGPAVVPMGTRVLVFGGGRWGEGVSEADGHRDGALFDLKTREWRSIAPAPFPLVSPAGVWTGRHVVIVGTEVSCSNEFGENECRTGTLRTAVYTPSTNRWRTIELPREIDAQNSWTPHAIRWTGSEAMFSLGFGLVAIDPVRRSARAVWQETPPDSAGQCAGGRFFALVGLRYADPETLQLEPSVLRRRSSTFRSGGRPFTVPAPGTPLGATCTRTSVFVMSTDLTTVARYDVAARHWSSVTPPTGATPCAVGAPGCLQYRFSGHGHVVDAWLPGEARAVRYDVRADRWADVAPGPGTDTSIDLTWTAGLGLTTRFSFDSGADTGELLVWRPA